MNKVLYILFIFFWAIPSSIAQLKTYSFEDAEKLAKDNPKPLVIFIHTDWCKYCKTMQNTTLKNKELITLLNDKFYFVDFNAEDKRKIMFNGKFFNYKPNGSSSGVHELALQLGTIDKQISYPTLCILNDKNEIVFQYNNFLNAKDLLLILDKIETDNLK